MEKKIKLFIGTPSYDGKFCHEYVSSMLQMCSLLYSHNIEYDVEFSVNDCFVDRSRNNLCDKFIPSNCTHFLMIDADMGWDPTAIIKMLETKKDFICGAVPNKNPHEEDYSLVINTNADGTPLVKDGLLSTLYVGAAFMLCSRKVFNDYNDFGDKIIYQPRLPYFKTEYKADCFLGEDVYFCNAWRFFMKEIWIYPDIDFIHDGHKGNYHKYLLKQPQPVS